MARGRKLAPEARARRRAVVQTCEFVLLVGLLSTWAYFGLMRPLIGAGPLAAGIAFLLVQCLFVPTVTGYVTIGKYRRSRAERRREKHMPEIREAVAGFATGAPLQEVGSLNRRYPDLVEEALLEFVPVVSGSQGARLVDLAERLQMLKRWIRTLETGTPGQRRGAIGALASVSTPASRAAVREAMNDELAPVRADACRAVLRIGNDDDVIDVVRLALGENLLTRAMLSDDLKMHAATIAARVVPELADDSDPTALERALSMLASWRVLVPFPGLGELLGHSEPRVVARALEILPFTPDREELAGGVIARLVHDDAGIRRAAAFASGRLRARETAPHLAELLHDPDREVARAAAAALGRLGTTGRSFLDAAVLASDRRSAGLALEALERMRVSPRVAVGE